MMLMGPIGPASSKARMDLMTVIQLCGLTSDLKLCLDAGDDASYSSGQKWLDQSGGGYDFFLGADGSATSTDPTFNGTVGRRSSSEYWSFDGGDYFTYDTTMEQWMKDLGKLNSPLSFIHITYLPSDTNAVVFSTKKNAGGSPFIGMQAQYAASPNRFEYFVADAAGTGATGFGGGTPNDINTLVPNTFIVGYAGPNANANHNSFVDGRVGGPASTGSTNFNTGDANGVNMRIGADADVSTPILSTARIHAVMVWQGLQLSPEMFKAFFYAVRGKFGK